MFLTFSHFCETNNAVLINCSN